MNFFFRSLLQISDESDFPKALSVLPKEWETAATYIDANTTYDGDITFIIGPWGSGKSTFVSTLLNQKDKYKNIANPEVISLSTATTDTEVFTHLINSTYKFYILWLAYVISLICFLYEAYLNYSSIKIFLSLLLSYFVAIFVTNKLRLTYIVSAFFETRRIRKLKIIEDFDRGSLSISSIYNTLLFRHRTNTSYIVSLGYNSISQRDHYIEAAMKLNGKLLFFDLSEDSLYNILVKTSNNPPIKCGKWITCFPARRLISLALQYENGAKILDGPDRFILFVEIFFEALEKHISLKDRGALDFGSNGFRLAGHSGLSSDQVKIIDSFLISLNPGEFNSSMVKHHRDDSNNRRENFMRNLISRRNYKEVVRPTVEISET